MNYNEEIITFNNTKSGITEKRKLLKISSQDLRMLVCKRWSHNRPVDWERVSQIKKYIEKNNTVEGIIYIAELNGEIVCYDGNHRREAVKNYNIEILVDIIYKATNEDIKYMFEILNKAQSVSELYFDTSDVDKNFICEIVEKIERKWPMMRGGLGKTGRCQLGNYTVDKLKDQLYRHFKNKMYDTTLTVDQIMNKIEEINIKYFNNTEFLGTFKPRPLNKCHKNGCFIFLKDFTEDL